MQLEGLGQVWRASLPSLPIYPFIDDESIFYPIYPPSERVTRPRISHVMISGFFLPQALR